MYNENEIVNSIIVSDFNNVPVDLIKTYGGKTILLIIYNNQCLGCTGRAIPLAYELQKKYSDIQVIGIHTRFNEALVNEKEIRSIFTIENLPFPIYLDNDKSVYSQFSSEGTPQWILITKNGKFFRSIFGSQEGAQNRLSFSLEELEVS